MKEQEKSIVPKWLKELQQRSWEPEILLSGIVLYGMFKVPELLDEFLAFFKLNIFGNSQDIDNLVALFKMGIYWLIGGLILHLICRGIWIGMVGLSYTFPKGIRQDKLAYTGDFQKKTANIPTYEKIVTRLEKISSSLFSVSFMLFMSLIGGYFFFLILIFIPFTITYISYDIAFESVFFDFFQVYVITLVGIGLVALLDFVSLGYLRRFKWFSKIYWPFHKVISVLTLSRFYRPIYYGLVTNYNKWALFIFLFAFSIVSILGAGNIANNSRPGDSFSRISLWNSAFGYNVYPGYYDNQNQDKPSTQAQIPSDIIDGNVLKIFVVSNILYEDKMLEYTSMDSLRMLYSDTATAALQLMIVNNYLHIIIDDVPVEIDRWYHHFKASTNQRGYLAYVTISDLVEGMHHLKVQGPTSKYYTIADIPFYRDIAFRQSSGQSKESKEEESSDFQPKPFGIRE